MPNRSTPTEPARRRFHCAAAAAMVTHFVPMTATAQASAGFPSRPVMVKVGVAAGGPADTAIRSAQPLLQQRLGVPVVVDNMPGAGGAIAVSNVLAQPQDGHVLFGGPGPDFLVAPLLAESARYRPEEFQLVTVLGVSDFLLVSSAKHDFRSAIGLLTKTRSAPEQTYSLAHWGPGSAPHLVGADFQKRTGVRCLEVPYKGAAPVLADLAGAQVDLAFVPLNAPTLGLIRLGKVRPIAIAGDRRNPALPEVQTLSESIGLQEFDYTVWSAVFAPPRVPEGVVAQLGDAFNEWIVGPDNLARVAANASRRVEAQNPAQKAQFFASESAKYRAMATSLRRGG